ncbi:hypothetical protein SAMN05421856_103284 [Chryseobacterium taichungense]|uniref:Uncharacterized protein n=1 Tax=Chryseobacterium taichungense TaxID=295069 RepID=A0A1H7YF60_9FLAO|nr:hypothetical protein SAMN05421856_103284 [Chryseobacterium taichungense]
METWGTSIRESDSFAGIYREFFDLYIKDEQSEIISKKIIDEIGKSLK